MTPVSTVLSHNGFNMSDLIFATVGLLMQTWIHGEESVNSKIKITLQEPPHTYTTRLDTSRKNIVPVQLKGHNECQPVLTAGVTAGARSPGGSVWRTFWPSSISRFSLCLFRQCFSGARPCHLLWETDVFTILPGQWSGSPSYETFIKGFSREIKLQTWLW